MKKYKWICRECPKPCTLMFEDCEFDKITGAPTECPYNGNAKWEEVK